MLFTETAGDKAKPANATAAREPRPVSVRMAVLLLYSLFIFFAVANIIVTIHVVIAYVVLHQPLDGDFPMFYAAADNIISNPQNLYDRATIVDSISRAYGFEGLPIPDSITGWFRYYNPPFYLFLLAPLSLLEIHVAYAIAVSINIIALAALLFLAGVALRWRQPITLLVAAASLGFESVYSAIIHTQPNILIAVALLGAFLAAERKRTLLASLLVALATAKPHWAALTSVALLRSNWRAVLPLALAGAVLVAGPFLFFGVGVLRDYVALVTDRAGLDLTEPRYSALLHNWVGFVRAAAGSPQPTVALVLSLVTLALLLPVFLRGERELVWPAAIFATVIAVPHVHAHEWVLTIPASALLLRRPMSAPALALTAFLLMAVHTGANATSLADDAVIEGGRFIYWQVLAAFLLVIWCAVLPLLDARLGGVNAHRVPRTALYPQT